MSSWSDSTLSWLNDWLVWLGVLTTMAGLVATTVGIFVAKEITRRDGIKDDAREEVLKGALTEAKEARELALDLTTKSKEAEAAQAKKEEEIRRITLYQNGESIGEMTGSAAIDEPQRTVVFEALVCRVRLNPGDVVQFRSFTVEYVGAATTFSNSPQASGSGFGVLGGSFKCLNATFKIR